MDLKNMTMDDLKQKLAAVDKKTLIKFGWSNNFIFNNLLCNFKSNGQRKKS